MAGEAAADEVDRREVLRADLADVLEAAGFGEATGEDRPAVGVELDLPGDPHPGALEAEVEAADAREEGANIHFPPLCPEPSPCPEEAPKTSIQLAGSYENRARFSASPGEAEVCQEMWMCGPPEQGMQCSGSPWLG